jgi:phosphate transport system permease protein
VLLTAGSTLYLNFNPVHEPMMSLPLAAFQLVSAPIATMITRGFGAATVLLVLVLVLFFIARMIGGRGPGQLTPRQLRRRMAESHRDLSRYTERAMALQRAMSDGAAAADNGGSGP